MPSSDGLPFVVTLPSLLGGLTRQPGRRRVVAQLVSRDGDSVAMLSFMHDARGIDGGEAERLPVIGDQLRPGEANAGEVGAIVLVFRLQQLIGDFHADPGVVVGAHLHQQLCLAPVVGLCLIIDHQACLNLGLHGQDVLGVKLHVSTPAMEQQLGILHHLDAAVLAVAHVGLLDRVPRQAWLVEVALNLADLDRLPLVGGAAQDIQLDLAELDAGIGGGIVLAGLIASQYLSLARSGCFSLLDQ